MRRASPAVLLAVVFLGIAVVPLSLRPINAAVAGELPPLGYLPSLQYRRPHVPFREDMIGNLRYADPRWVFIGDSMLGSRINPQYLGQISGTGDENVSFLFHPATGPAWWYLAFKNVLVASGEKPRVTFVFFRDTNLTDTMFRLEGLYGGPLDTVARPPLERELDALVAARRRGVWHGVHNVVSRVYQADFATSWMEPGVRRWFANWRNTSPGAIEAFEWNIGQSFEVDHLRHDVHADLTAAEEANFNRDLPTSVLPLMIALSKEHGLPLCFVRVQRRPINGRPPEQSPQLLRYVADLERWLEANGALFHDDNGDPEQTLDLYTDGDHMGGDRKRYTEIFRRRLDPLFRPLTVPGAP